MLDVSPSPLWAAFAVVVTLVIALDLGVLHRRPRASSVREAAAWSGVWIALALGFAGLVWASMGAEPAIAFVTAYAIEKSLSVDNLFVFLVVFSALGIGREHQHRVLFWGIVGALALRGAMILAGLELLARFHWLVYLFGAFLVVTGLKLLHGWARGDDDGAPALVESRLFRIVQRVIPSTRTLHGGRFTVIEAGRRVATPLLVALILVELSDVVFALDSIPAVVAISRDPFIVLTSNVFAILGLRSLYFVLAASVARFEGLKLGLAGVLVFVGAKMALVGVFTIPPLASLAIVLVLLLAPLALPKRRPTLQSSVIETKLEGP